MPGTLELAEEQFAGLKVRQGETIKNKEMKLVCGWGVNDANYVIRDCLIYRCWVSMIKRCHCPKYQARQRTYVDCWIDERWKYFMAFRAWYLEQNPKPGEQLDKDFLGGGKLYSPETCCFVIRLLNNVFGDHRIDRGLWPQGVTRDKLNSKFVARMNRKGKTFHLGCSDTPEEASAAYLKAKAAYVEELLAEFPQSLRLAEGIRRKMTELIEQEEALWGTYLTTPCSTSNLARCVTNSS